ncbi:FtsQ-type POTRA domain-containing protein [uncultured Ilyobacter sp.]|uniref:cell division protein FtsQ/DivIB n=1 Tax=uncultured Ilyobacter sp. TaxID=544433 RepID=UPI002AA6654B|nr:FtsQ-type POTRA domain-containing protein [uncultured Ilyobacter sp.]
MKVFFRIILLFLFAAAFFYMDQTFLQRDIFRVEKIWIFGDLNLTQREVKKQMGTVIGEYIWGIDPKAIEEILEEDIRIEKAKVKKILPDEIRVEITEKDPSYYAQYKDRVYTVDESGKIFAYLEETSVRDLPLLLIKKEEQIPELLKILNKIKGKKIEKLISQIYIYNKWCINFVLFDGTIVKTDNNVEEKKYDVAERLYSELKLNQNDLEYMDIRFSDYIVK